MDACRTLISTSNSPRSCPAPANPFCPALRSCINFFMRTRTACVSCETDRIDDARAADVAVAGGVSLLSLATSVLLELALLRNDKKPVPWAGSSWGSCGGAGGRDFGRMDCVGKGWTGADFAGTAGTAGTGSTWPGGGGPADSELNGREELLALISRAGGGPRSSAGRLPLRVGGGICSDETSPSAQQ